MLLSAEHLSKNYGMKTLLEDASIYLEQGEKIGVIGINGTGKSTLLRLLSGTEAPDEGAVRRDPNVQVSYLRQNPEMNPNASILEQVFLGFPGISGSSRNLKRRPCSPNWASQITTRKLAPCPAVSGSAWHCVRR